MFDELTKSVKASLYERAISPLFGTFVISWAVWNYKFIFVLISSMPVDEKLDYIDTFIYFDIWSCILIGFIYPLITALLFIFIYPYPALYVYKYWQEKQKKLKEAKQSIEDETPLTIEESRNIRRELFQLESEYDKELARKDAEIERLKAHNQVIEEELDSKLKISEEAKSQKISKSDVDEKDEPDEDRIEILKLISKNGGMMKDDDIVSTAPYDKVKTEYYLEDLTAKGYLSRDYNQRFSAFTTGLTTISKELMVRKGYAK